MGFWGAALAIGSAPENYQSDPKIQGGVKLLREWLVKNMDAQTPLDRVVLLWASTKLNGLLTRDQQNQIVDETLAKQRDDGGFAMSLPCLPGEAECDPSGSNVIRNDDGLHFCPGSPPPGPCTVYASGAFRFANAIAQTIATK